MSTRTLERAPDEQINWVTSIPFFAAHLLCLAALVTGISARALVLGAVLYFGRMWFITAGYHRYFSHRSYRAGRVVQFLLAFGGSSAVQKGPLWWAAHHRDHHRHADTDGDIHSPRKGFWWSHVGWILSDKHSAANLDNVRDLAKYPELRFVERFDWIAPWALGVACYLVAGWSGVVVGFFWSTVLLWHGTFTVNSLAHVMGRRRYATDDTSRNSALISLWTGGEGWHNNHHYFQASARQGFYWWEYDPTFYGLKVLSWLHLVHDLKTPPARVKAAGRVRDGSFDVGMFKVHWAKATAAVAAAGHGDRPAEDRIHASRAAVEDYVASSLRSAEELAKLSRRRAREVSLSD